jgi:hypothetical protein
LGQVRWGGPPDEQGAVIGDPGCPSGSHVTWLIPDQDRSGQVEVEVVCRGNDQPWLGFATSAISLRKVERLRMVRTCVYTIEDDPTFAECSEKKGVDDHDV